MDPHIFADSDPTDPDPKHWFNRDFIVQDDDEQDLVGNEEEQAEEIEEIKGNEDFKGKIHYKLEYDFTTQELKVTVSQHSATIIKLDKFGKQRFSKQYKR